VALEPELCFRKALGQRVDQIAERLPQLALEQVAVFLEPFAALVKAERLEEGNGLLAKTLECGHGRYPLPMRASQASSSITSMPRSVACLSFDPAPGPATTRSVLA